jgi:hypothetical protein
MLFEGRTPLWPPSLKTHLAFGGKDRGVEFTPFPSHLHVAYAGYPLQVRLRTWRGTVCFAELCNTMMGSGSLSRLPEDNQAYSSCFFPNKPVAVDGFGDREVEFPERFSMPVSCTLWYFPYWTGPIAFVQQEWVMIIGDKISAVCIRVLFSGSAVAGVLVAPQQSSRVPLP